MKTMNWTNTMSNLRLKRRRPSNQIFPRDPLHERLTGDGIQNRLRDLV